MATKVKREPIEVYFYESGAGYKPAIVKDWELIKVGGILFHIHRLFTYDGEIVKGQRALSRHGMHMTTIDEPQEDLKAYIRSRAADRFPDGKGGCDRKAFLEGILDHWSKYAHWNPERYNKEFFKREREYLSEMLQVQSPAPEPVKPKGRIRDRTRK